MRLEDLVIDEEFKAIFDADGHTPEQLQGMEESLMEFGYGGDRIEHWHGKIVDGYTRYAIWLKTKDDPDAPVPEIFEIGAKDRAACIRYILSKQINRRNVHKKRLAYYRGKLAKQTIPVCGQGQPEGHVHKNGRKPPSKKIRKGHAIASAKMGVDRVTLHRSEKFAEAVDSLDARGVASKKELLESTMPMTTLVKAAKATTKSEAQQILGNAAPTPVSAKLELGKRFGSPLKLLQKLNEDYPCPKFKAIEAAIREWYEQASQSI